jgi:hypothetical protein
LASPVPVLLEKASMNCLSRMFARFPSMLSAALCGAVLGAMLTSPTLARADDESSKKESADPFSKLTADAKRHDGLLPLYRKEDKLYAEIPQRLIDKEFFVTISIARGIGDRFLLGGLSWGDGDDWVWAFHKVDDKLQVTRKNVRFFAERGSPEAAAVTNAFTDSILYSVPILAKTPAGGHLIDLEKIFFADLPKISNQLSGFSFAKDRSTWASAKAFEDNVEIEVAATYASSGKTDLDTVPDSRAATLTIHYSLSLLPQNNYHPRLADPRVGYFVTALKDFSQGVDDDRFVRYINRWQLEKADPKAKVSPPKKPIVFWIEKTVPYRYRQPIREGIEAWNAAFEEAGFASAIEVRQQPDKTDWDPEDVNYNTFRWITSGRSFAMGPSRVNPRTGQILDADIIFDADFVKHWQTEFETFTPESIAWLTGGLDPTGVRGINRQAAGCGCGHCSLFAGHSYQTALGVTALAAIATPAVSEQEKEKLVRQGLKLVAMHELGHTLGLRHNFKGSSLASLADINAADAGKRKPASTSVMDYIPVNIVPKGQPQAAYYQTQLGVYDRWAIEYGYTPLPGSRPEDEKEGLEKIASRSGEPLLAFATDEDTESGDPDPFSNRYDLGNDPVAFAKQRAALVQEVIPQLVERFTADDAGYERVRQAFGVLLAAHGQAAFIASRLIGGLHGSRSHRDDPGAPPPFTVVEAKQQRAALDLLSEQVFSDKPFSFPPEFYNQLVSTRWLHWGAKPVDREDYPVHEVVLLWQQRVLDQLLNARTLTRLADSELKLPADEDAFTVAELLDRLTQAVFAEAADLADGSYTARKPAISSLRRNLQRAVLEELGSLALGRSGHSLKITSSPHGTSISHAGSPPPDARALAALQLRRLARRIDKLLKRADADEAKITLDDPSRAHLEDLAARIEAILDADVVTTQP